MSTRSVASLQTVAFLLLSAPLGASQQAKPPSELSLVLERHRAALGGVAELDAVQSYREEGTYYSSNSATGYHFMTSYGLLTAPLEPSDRPGLVIFIGPLIHSSSTTLLGREQADGRDAIHLRVGTDEPIPRDYFLDQETYLTIRYEEGHPGRRNAWRLSDYRRVGRVTLPFRREVTFPDGSVTIYITDKIELNSGQTSYFSSTAADRALAEARQGQARQAVTARDDYRIVGQVVNMAPPNKDSPPVILVYGMVSPLDYFEAGRPLPPGVRISSSCLLIKSPDQKGGGPIRAGGYYESFAFYDFDNTADNGTRCSVYTTIPRPTESADDRRKRIRDGVVAAENCRKSLGCTLPGSAP